MNLNIDQFLDEHEHKSLLRFITCGSVDDGKSTLIGRLLYDSKLIFDDQLSALSKDSARVGNAGEGEIDYALLLDGLKAEREQGITIDVAYRYFATPKRKFIIADTPGHEQYTRNMATGASTADLAVILIDARQGVLTQTKRHSFIVSLLGIKHAVVAVNKMDLVDYRQEVYDAILADYQGFVEKLKLPDMRFIPLSALRGDNIVETSPRMPWYEGPPLLETLETVDVGADRNLDDFRFPVQFVSRPNLDFRGFAGTIVSGVVKVGDRVKALPSMRESNVKAIVTADGPLKEAFTPQAVTIELEDEIDISSGEMLVHTGALPHVARHFEAVVIWMSDSPMREGGAYVVRHAGQATKVRVRSLLYSIDVNSLAKSRADHLDLNEIGRVGMTANRPLFFDEYVRNHETGSFILIDPVSNTTVAGGMIVKGLVDDGERDDGERPASVATLQRQVERREFMWERGLVTPAHRIAKNQHRGQAILVTGSKNTGKRDLARRLELSIFKSGFHPYYLGVSNLIEGLDADVGDNFWDRDEHIRRIGELCRIMTDAGLIFISSVDDVDEYDLRKLRTLGSPNEVIVVAIGDVPLADDLVDVALAADTEPGVAVGRILALLTRLNVLMEYYI